jgi:septum formation inhibitor MinC
MSESKKDSLSPSRPKRSSLKMANMLDPKEIMSYQKKKRNSVSFQLGGNFKFKELRAKFEDIKPEKKKNPEEKKAFSEARRKSIKNEFALVKEMLKKEKAIEEVENETEEVKENTDKNLKVGKEYEESEESEKSSQKSENSEKSEENKTEVKEEKEEKKDNIIIDDKKNIIQEEFTFDKLSNKKFANKKNDEFNVISKIKDGKNENVHSQGPSTSRDDKKEPYQFCKFC